MAVLQSALRRYFRRRRVRHRATGEHTRGDDAAAGESTASVGSQPSSVPPEDPNTAPRRRRRGHGGSGAGLYRLRADDGHASITASRGLLSALREGHDVSAATLVARGAIEGTSSGDRDGLLSGATPLPSLRRWRRLSSPRKRDRRSMMRRWPVSWERCELSAKG